MTKSIIGRRQLLAAGLAAGMLPRPSLAAFPDRPIRWLVGFPPGGATDLLARLLGQSISTKVGQPVLVENRPGAAASIAAEALARAAPDGQTVMSVDNGVLVINPVIYNRIPYDPDRDFRPVGLFARIHIMLAVRADSPIRNVAEYMERARSSPEGMTYASPSLGTPLHLAMERLARDARLKLTHVPYRGMAPAMNDLLAGSVPSIVLDYTTAAELVRSGRIRALAVFSPERLPALSDVPTFAETGMPGFSAVAWQGMIVPRATPDPIVARLEELLGQALAEPAVRQRYTELGLDIPPSDTATFVRAWQSDKEVLQPLIRSLGITLDS